MGLGREACFEGVCVGLFCFRESSGGRVETAQGSNLAVEVVKQVQSSNIPCH